jgi:hypothetical protein
LKVDDRWVAQVYVSGLPAVRVKECKHLVDDLAEEHGERRPAAQGRWS